MAEAVGETKVSLAAERRGGTGDQCGAIEVVVGRNRFLESSPKTFIHPGKLIILKNLDIKNDL